MTTRFTKLSFIPIKQSLFIAIISLNSLVSFAQLKVDAGKDTTYCVSAWFKPMILGADVQVENGTPPYTFAWEYYHKISDKFIITASDYLNDTTLQSPSIISYLSWPEWRKFIFHVTDANGNYAKDSIYIRLSLFNYLTGGEQPWFYIEKGDSVLLRFPNSGIGGGIEPLTYYWQPKTYLSDPDSVVTWCKPDSSLQYEAFAIDSCGCVSEKVLVYDIRVLPETNDNKPEFAPIGAEWYYSAYVGLDPPQGANYIKHTCTKDSTINGKSVKVIQKTKFTREGSIELGFEYLLQNGDTIFYWKNDEFHELYNFSLSKGDSIQLFADISNNFSCDTSQYSWNSIDSVFSQTINNHNLKGYFATHKEGNYWGFEGFPIIEKIGSTGYLLPEDVGCVVDRIGIGPLRCYSDPEFGTFYNGKEPCDTITTFPVYSPAINRIDLFKLYPNPANNKITISNPSNIKINKIEMFDFSGRVIQQWETHELEGNQLNIQHILPGIYLIKAETEGGIKTEKLVIQ